MSFRIALTADLHYGTRHATGRQATHDLVTHLTAHPPDLLILAGDIGAGDDFDRCLALFESLPCATAWRPACAGRCGASLIVEMADGA